MGVLYIGLLILCVIVICESLPVDRTELDNDRKNNKFNDVFDKFVSESGHNIVRRIRRSKGIINGNNCADGKGKLSTGECVDCNGRSLPGCPKSPVDPDFANYG